MARKKSKGKKAAQKKQSLAENDYGRAPHTFVFNRGKVGKNGLQLMLDMRHVMEPYTASSLRARKKNTLKDFVGVAGPLGISHFLSFTKTESAIHMRVMRLPRGPTLTFRVKKYSLARDVVSSLKRPSMYASQFLHHPLLILNNFNGDALHFRLMTTMFQNMFPSINVNKIHLNDIRRCVLLNFNHETKLIEFRHYTIKAVPMGMSRSTKKLLQNKVPSLGRYEDVSEFFLNTGQLSESEAEMDGEHNEVTLPQRLASRGNLDNQKSAIRLIEIGPRLQLELIKIEEGLCEGEVLHHEFITKTKEEIAAAREVKFRKKNEKIKRKKQQEANVIKKQKEKDENKVRSMEGIRKKFGAKEADGQKEGEKKAEVEEDDDTEYYRQEVGQEPDAGLFPKKRSSQGVPGGERGNAKRPRFDSQGSDRRKDGGGDGGRGGRGRGSGRGGGRGDRGGSRDRSRDGSRGGGRGGSRDGSIGRGRDGGRGGSRDGSRGGGRSGGRRGGRGASRGGSGGRSGRGGSAERGRSPKFGFRTNSGGPRGGGGRGAGGRGRGGGGRGQKFGARKSFSKR